jgi:hypothetical protein
MAEKPDEVNRQPEEAPAASGGAPCAHIEDPVRRALCHVCGLPVVGEAPFCKDHEPPVP